MNIADFIISGKFGENYSKVLAIYFNTYFDYTTFLIEDNGIVTKIEVSAKIGSEIAPLIFEFKKDYIANQMTLRICCMYQNLLPECNYVYKNFVNFAEIFENTLVSHEELQKFYVN